MAADDGPALALPDTLPQRDLIVSMTVGVVLLSIVGQGVSMPVLMRALCPGGDPDEGSDSS